MIEHQFFSLFQESLWSILLDQVGLTEDNENNDKDSAAGEKEDIRLYLVRKLKVWFLPNPKQIMLTIKQIKIGTIRTQLIAEGKVCSISKTSYQLLSDAESVRDKLNAVLAMANGYEELVESLTSDWLEKRKKDSQGSQDEDE